MLSKLRKYKEFIESEEGQKFVDEYFDDLNKKFFRKVSIIDNIVNSIGIDRLVFKIMNQCENHFLKRYNYDSNLLCALINWLEKNGIELDTHNLQGFTSGFCEQPIMFYIRNVYKYGGYYFSIVDGQGTVYEIYNNKKQRILCM